MEREVTHRGIKVMWSPVNRKWVFKIGSFGQMMKCDDLEGAKKVIDRKLGEQK